MYGFVRFLWTQQGGWAYVALERLDLKRVRPDRRAVPAKPRVVGQYHCHTWYCSPYAYFRVTGRAPEAHAFGW